MLNKAPIFLNGFKYGGTNLIMNLLASHPDVCWLSSETQFVFNSRRGMPDRWIRKFFYYPIRMSSGDHVLHRTKDIDTPRRLSNVMKPYVDLFFFVDKMTTGNNRFKFEGLPYTMKELKNCRFLAKNVNGLVLASDIFAQMYPDAAFIALVRNGLALCEGFMRRGWSAEEVGRMYETVCQKMLHDSRSMPDYHIVTFEEMVSAPVDFLRKIYGYGRLDIDKVKKVRLQAKRSMNEDGTRSYTFGGSKDRETHWFTLEELGSNVRNDVNANQIERLSARDKEIFLKIAGRSMEQLGYL